MTYIDICAVFKKLLSEQQAKFFLIFTAIYTIIAVTNLK